MIETVRAFADRIGPRPAGTPAEREAEAYLAGALRDLGAPVRRETFRFRAWEADGPAALVLDAGGTRHVFDGLALPYTLPTARDGVGGVLRAAGHWPLIPGRLLCRRYEVVDERGEAQAALLVSANGASRPLPNMLPLLALPTVVVDESDGAAIEALVDAAARGRVEATIVSLGVRERLATSANLVVDVGEVESGALAVIAHYDCVPSSPGANDNASGVAVLLRLVANALADPGRGVGVRFVFLGAEEPFLVGSRSYVAAAAGRGDLERIRACLNFDMLGFGESFAMRLEPGSVWETVLDDVLAEHEARPTLARTPLPASSDHWAFHEVGIPSAQLTRGGDDEWHSPHDVSARFGEEELEEAADLAWRLVAAARVAFAPEASVHADVEPAVTPVA